MTPRSGSTQLTEAPAALRRRVLRLAALAAGCPGSDLFAVHVDALDALVVTGTASAGSTCPAPSPPSDAATASTSPDARPSDDRRQELRTGLPLRHPRASCTLCTWMTATSRTT